MKKIRSNFILISILCLIVFYSCNNEEKSSRRIIDLSGEWQFETDSEDKGIDGEWFNRNLNDKIDLPGTTDIGKKGKLNIDSTTSYLSRVYTYTGAAWYKKEIEIPQDWEGKHVQLIMERTKPAMVWIDNKFVGESILLESPQVYDLSSYISPGKHSIAIRIDNSLNKTPYGNVHIYSDDTQTNWNGIIGRFCLEASSKTYIKDIQAFPDVDNKKIIVKIKIGNPLKSEKIIAELLIEKMRGPIHVRLKPVSHKIECDSVLKIEYDLSGNFHLWDDYHQNLYNLTVKIKDLNKKWEDCMAVNFGMRKFSVKGTRFAINDRITFLRGKNDACVFPLTGHVPMDEETWMKVMSIAKEYGINHYRFHSWCPPEAAFRAADKLGIFVQVELSFWGQISSDTITEQLLEEGYSVLKNYANHPSFVMFSMGNEIWGDLQKAGYIMNKLKKADKRPLYTHGSNDNIGYSEPTSGSDYFLAARTPSAGDDPNTHTRLTHAFADSKDGGLLNSRFPSTKINFDYPVQSIHIPLVSHEVGQYQIYPDFKEIEKYTGVLKAKNLEIFKKRLENSGMAKQDIDFNKASGALSAICYRAEIEAALRTGGMAGFQLLDLQDYPGQGTALVGILDAFMDSKNVIAKEEWRHFTNDVVPLLIFDKYCWTNDEFFKAEVKVANYSDKKIKRKILWKVTDESGNLYKSGVLNPHVIPNEGLNSVGFIKFSLALFNVAMKLNVNIYIDSTKYMNSYPVWVYPKNISFEIPEDIMVSTILNKALLLHIEAGGKVLLMPKASSVSENSLPGMFISDFWNFGMFKQISQSAGMPVSPGTMGLLMDPKHALFSQFPTEFHTDWQWWSIIKNSNSLIIDNIGNDYKPIVQVIDNMERNHKLGMIFEFKIGKGKLLICMSRLTDNLDIPEVRQLYKSILSYMSSTKFNPQYNINEDQLKQMVRYSITRF
jgi:hypothetical protein